MSGCCGAGDVLYIIKDVERVAACPLQPEPCELCHQLVKQVLAGCTAPMHQLLQPPVPVSLQPSEPGGQVVLF